jgi:hypothetical protein
MMGGRMKNRERPCRDGDHAVFEQGGRANEIANPPACGAAGGWVLFELKGGAVVDRAQRADNLSAGAMKNGGHAALCPPYKSFADI